MRIDCPHCGLRDLAEFSYCGDADNAASRPQSGSTDQDAWNAFIYDRTNPAGDHAEIWQHAGGCRRHLRLVRSTLTHAISDITILGPKA